MSIWFKLSIVLSLIGLFTGAGFYAHAQWTGRYRAGYDAGQKFERNDLAEKLNANRKAEADRIKRIALQRKENADADQQAHVDEVAHMSALNTAAYSQLSWLQHAIATVPSAPAAQADPSVPLGGTGLVDHSKDRSDLESDRIELGNESWACKVKLQELNRVRTGWIGWAHE